MALIFTLFLLNKLFTFFLDEDVEYEEAIKDDVEITLDPQSQQELETMKAMGLPVGISGDPNMSKIEINIKVGIFPSLPNHMKKVLHT